MNLQMCWRPAGRLDDAVSTKFFAASMVSAVDRESFADALLLGE